MLEQLPKVTAPSFLHVTPKYYYLWLVVPLIVVAPPKSAAAETMGRTACAQDRYNALKTAPAAAAR